LRHSEYQPSGVYVRAGDRLEISASGLIRENLFAVIGVPELDTPVTIPLTFGRNIIEATSAGLLSFINQNDSGTCYVTVGPVVARVPMFTLGSSTNADFVLQMIAYPAAPVVLLTSNRAIIVVRYRSAQSYLNDPLTLMRNFDRFIAVQDDISGVGDWALEQCRVDPNKLLYVETDSGYMQATQGYMSFKGEYPLTALLGTDPEHGWGPWHESGHQRQVAPMTWWLGTGVSEVMVNLYAMAVQEIVQGRASRLDSVYPATKIYLQQPFRDYNAIEDAFEKLVMLWQLRLTFGTAFYKQLHQCYRLMQDLPATEVDKAQRFITETSLLAGLDLTPFYDKWGLYATASTLVRLEHLPTLTQPLWETDATHTFPLPIFRPGYIPVLAYLKLNVGMAGVGDNAFQVFVRGQWLQPYLYEISVNGQVVASVDNGVGLNCSVLEDGNDFSILVPYALVVKDKLEMYVVLDNVRHRLFVSGRYNALMKLVLDLMFTDSTQTEIMPTLDQPTLDALFIDLERHAVDDGLFESFHRAQKLLLATTISSIELGAGASESTIAVVMKGEALRHYKYEMVVALRTLASLDHGAPESSFFIDNIWGWVGTYNTDLTVVVRVTMNGGHRYDLVSTNWDQQHLSAPVMELFSDRTRTALRPGVVQADVDAAFEAARGHRGLSRQNRAIIIEYVPIAQKLLSRTAFLSVLAGPTGISVHFNGDAFKNNLYYVYKNGVYASEMIKGHPAYSSLTLRHWRTSVPLNDQDTWEVVQILAGYTYTLYSSSDEEIVLAQLQAGSEAVITNCGNNALPASS
jgi:hypothetical protein